MCMSDSQECFEKWVEGEKPSLEVVYAFAKDMDTLDVAFGGAQEHLKLEVWEDDKWVEHDYPKGVMTEKESDEHGRE